MRGGNVTTARLWVTLNREVVSMLEARAAIQRNLNMTEKQAGKS